MTMEAQEDLLIVMYFPLALEKSPTVSTVILYIKNKRTYKSLELGVLHNKILIHIYRYIYLYLYNIYDI